MPICAIFRNRLEDSLLEMRRQRRIVACWWSRVFCDLFIPHREEIRSNERRMPCKEFVSNHIQSILIAFFTDDPLKLLRCHVTRRALVVHLFDTCHIQRSSKAKIGNESLFLCIKKNVSWLEVTMHNVLSMRIVERFTNLGKD